MWLGLGFGCGAGPCPWGCHPPPLPAPGCHEGKPGACWGDGGGRDGEPMGGMEGVVPVGVVGLLEKPEPAEGKDRGYDRSNGGENSKGTVHVLECVYM